MIEPSVRTVSVGRLVRHLKEYVESNKHLKVIAVRGEISNYRPSSGTVYFDLKDEDAIISVIIFSKDAARLPLLANGQAVIATGRVSIFERTSKYQLIAASVKVDGVGDLHAAYEELKRKLDREGIFAEDRKRALPRFPFRIGLVSSRTAAGADDFVEIVRKRAPHVAIVWFETPVQNMLAVPDMVDAIDRASRADVDVIAVVRGGGSFEDLFPFSSEGVVRAIARAQHPVVAAVGHNVDFPLCDLVADWRAPTPSAAAARIAPEAAEIADRLERAGRLLGMRAQEAIAGRSETLRRFARAGVFTDPARLIGPLEQRLDYVRERLKSSAHGRLRSLGRALLARQARLARHDAAPAVARRREDLAARRERLRAALGAYLVRHANRLGRLRDLLEAKNPEHILRQGYAIVMEGERVLSDAAEVQAGAAVRAKLARGTLHARVEAVEANEREEKR